MCGLVPCLRVPSVAFPGLSVQSWIRSGADGLQTDTHTGCGDRQWLYPLHHTTCPYSLYFSSCSLIQRFKHVLSTYWVFSCSRPLYIVLLGGTPFSHFSALDTLIPLSRIPNSITLFLRKLPANLSGHHHARFGIFPILQAKLSTGRKSSCSQLFWPTGCFLFSWGPQKSLRLPQLERYGAGVSEVSTEK